MKIYTSTEYINKNEEKVGNLRLKVISMWDWTTDSIAFETIYKGQPNEKSFSLALEKCIAVKEPGWTQWENVKLSDITKEMIEEMEKMGLYVSKKLTDKK